MITIVSLPVQQILSGFIKLKIKEIQQRKLMEDIENSKITQQEAQLLF
jgi:hypothetical protein